MITAIDRNSTFCKRNKEEDGVEDIIVSRDQQRRSVAKVLVEQSGVPRLRMYQSEEQTVVVETFTEEGLRLSVQIITTSGSVITPR